VARGGIGGANEKIVVEPDGIVKYWSGWVNPVFRTLQLSESEHALLLAHFECFFLLKESYLPDRWIVDGFE